MARTLTTDEARWQGGRGDRREWMRLVHSAAVSVLLGRGLDPVRAWWCAVALVTHWARETGYGRSMYAYNVGNIRASSGWTGDVVRLQGADDLNGPAPYRAYPDMEAGVRGALALAVDGSRYAPAWAYLLGSFGQLWPHPYGQRVTEVPCDAAGWYARLMRAGWHPYSDASLNDFRGVIPAVISAVGTPPVAVPLAVGVSLAAMLWGAVELATRRWPSLAVGG